MLSHADPKIGSVRAISVRASGAAEGDHHAVMSQFLGTHQNRLDAKGRTSVPASFRTALRATVTGEGGGLILRPSLHQPCIEAWPLADFQTLATPLNKLDVLSEEHDDLATSLYADAFPMEADKEGRIILPEILVAHAGLTDAVTFVGMGRNFHIWEPAAFARRREEAREKARLQTLTQAKAA
jgi:MraZ protein